MAKAYTWKNYVKGPGPAIVGGVVGLGLLWWWLKPAEAEPAPQVAPPVRPGPSSALPPGAVPVTPGTPPTPYQAPAGGWQDLFPDFSGVLAAAQAQGQGQSIPGPQAPGTQAGPMPLGNPIPLATGATYRARIELGAIEALAATRERVAQAFVDLGFRGVVAYQNAAELDGSWPPEARAGATDRTRWVRGTWTGAPQSIARPPNVVAAWIG